VISVVIPAFNGAQTLPEVIARTRAALGGDCELIVVDDASRDATWTVLQQLSQIDDVHAIRFRRNVGQHNALLAGIRAARGDVIVTLDDDLQHPPEEIPALLAALERGADVVYGFPQDQPRSFARSIVSSMTTIALRKAMGTDAARHHSGFRLFRASLREAFADYDGAYVNIDVMLTWATTRFSWIEVKSQPGKSGYTLARLFAHAMTLVTGFSTLPLRVASIGGLSFTAVGAALLAFVLIRYLIDGVSVPGFVFIASAVTMFSGVQLFALGIMGEYLSRIHMRTLGRPAYVIADVTERTP
jgi:undecaprenyl-phosphate 4-deoxy-4-formamido-L-arabinose transferase